MTGCQVKWVGPSGIAALSRGALIMLAIFLSACTTQYRNHGYVPSDAALAELVVGVDTRGSVEESIGQPTTTGLLEQARWIYVGSRFRYRGVAEPKEISRSIVAISFDSQDRVSNIERLDLQNGQPVKLSRRVTDTGVGEVTLWQQLLRNIGQFNPGDFLGAPQ